MAQTVVRGEPLTLDAFYSDNEGNAVNPVDPKVSIIDANGTTVVSLDNPTNVAVGHYQYVYLVASDALLGAWAARWFGTVDGKALEDEDGFTVTLAGSISTGGSGDGTTCTPWATSDDAPVSLLTYDVDPADIDDAFQMASDVLYELTGRRWPGTCTDVIRPQARWRGYDHDPRWWPSTGSLSPWGWCSCHRGRETGCAGVPEIKLPGHPVNATSVIVKIDGLELDAESYRLDDHRFLVRTDGEGWPCCQNLLLPDTEENTFSIAYAWGEGPPIGGKKSAVLLGTALFGDLFPTDAERCAIPARARTVTRSGVVIELGDPDAMVKAGITGIAAADLWVGSVLEGRKRRPAAVMVPGKWRSARRVGA